MKFIGITGGVGCGKSAIMSELSKKYNCLTVSADEVAKKLRRPGSECFEQICSEFRQLDVFVRDGHNTIVDIDDAKMAKLVFSEHDKLFLLNSIIHPAVKRYVLNDVEACRSTGNIDYYFFEAALILEDGYDKLCDETWYIYAPESVRRQRLKESRGYTDERIDSMLASQMPEEEFRNRCSYTIDNDGRIELTMLNIDIILNNN